jgi:RNA polymerase sigma-70 factor (ECF subfamily)
MDESTLLSRCRQSDESAWEALLSEYGAQLFRFCLGSLTREEDAAYDLAQETWCKAARYIQNFRGDSSFKTWLFRIAYNSWLNRCRTRERKPEAALVADDETGRSIEPVNMVSPDREVGARHDLEYVLGQLGPECERVLNMRYVLGYGEREIAEILEQNEKTVSARISRCRSRAREIFYAG